MVNTYHIDSFQNILSTNNKIEYALTKNNNKIRDCLSDIGQINLCNVKIRETSQYHLFDIFKLPDIQIIKIVDCQWKDHQKHSSISFNNFPTINSLARIKELSLHKCQIRKIDDTRISKYIYLRKLSLCITSFIQNKITILRNSRV